ncbi:MAG TPA: HD domain-containing protein [Chitinophagaceae bacterium]|nr:HD domain-containing protein [Chitinophagaceae bacterium]
MTIEFTSLEKKLTGVVSAAARELGMPCYLVGGFIRDRLLQRPSKDMDIVCIGDGITLAQAVAQRLGGGTEVTVFRNFGTAHLGYRQQETVFNIEFVGARKESYRIDSRKPEVSPASLEEDLDRRDFTINSLAVSLNEADAGILIDRFRGLDDLEKRLIRTPGDPGITFSDDPLRMMRAARFSSQLDFKVAPETLTAIQQEASRIMIISTERISDEFNKILLSPRPSIGLDILYKTEILKIIFPQLTDLAGVEMMEGKGHKDNFYHTLQVLDNISRHTDDLWLRWAALLHDIGKPATKKYETGHGWTFHGHDALGGKMVPRIFSRFKLPQHEAMRFVRKLVELHLRPISLSKEDITDSAMRRLLFDAGNDIEALMTLCEADITSKNEIKVKRYLRNFELVRQRLKEVEAKDRIRNWQPPVSGEMIMETFHIPPGRLVGDLKTAIREAILDGVIGNNYEEAYTFMIQKGVEMNLSPIK